MEPSKLPALVVEKDRRLQKASDDLAQLRWHWTLNEENPDRISINAYALQVGVARSAVQASANGYASFITAGGHDIVATPGQPETVTDHIELAKLGEEKKEAVKAVAKATGSSISNVAANKRQEVADVINTARERAVDRGTTVEHEIERAAEWREKARKTAKREQDQRKAAHTMRFVEFEGKTGGYMQYLRKFLEEDADYIDEEKELMVDTLAKLRALLNLIDLRIAGNTNVNWDAELEKLVK